jgi:hypothetical protein
VDSAAILEALEKVYAAKPLAREILDGRKTKLPITNSR